MLTASMDIDAVQKFLPEGKPLASFAVNQAQVFTTRSNVGAKTTYAVMPVVADQLYIMSSWNNPGGSSGFSNFLGPTWFPILLWVAGLGTSIWAAEILVVRHVRALNRSISSFARGQRHRLELDLSAAPLELHEMAKAYATMTDDITRNEANLEDNVHQKEVLLREVHHRVKNNLQLIASIMNMQIRQARTPEARGLLKGLQDRIISLATIHRGLYQTTGLTDIHANELLADITRQTVNMATGPGRQINVSTEFDDIRLTPDQAVPLSLFLTEALTNALKYARSPDGSAPLLHVALKRQSDGHAVLSLINSAASKPEMADPDTLNTSTGLGAQLLVAFSQQIGGTLSQEQIGDSYHLRITFVIADLVEAENRLAAIDETSDAAPAI
ncbi:MAG: sensor histidine kinase [Cypionkella sp.]